MSGYVVKILKTIINWFCKGILIWKWKISPIWKTTSAYISFSTLLTFALCTFHLLSFSELKQICYHNIHFNCILPTSSIIVPKMNSHLGYIRVCIRNMFKLVLMCFSSIFWLNFENGEKRQLKFWQAKRTNKMEFLINWNISRRNQSMETHRDDVHSYKINVIVKSKR